MANVCIVAGKSGTGKSTSTQNLDPASTFIVQVIGSKELPYRGSRKKYNKENKNLAVADSYDRVIDIIQAVSARAAHIKTLVIDDMGYVMRKENFDNANVKGFDKYLQMAVHFQSIIKEAEKARADLNIYFMLHLEDVVSDGAITEQKIALIGKLVDNQYNPQEVVSVMLISMASFTEEGEPEYKFLTRRSAINGIVYPAKTPAGMFEDKFISNDLLLVNQAMENYYNGEE